MDDPGKNVATHAEELFRFTRAGLEFYEKYNKPMLNRKVQERSYVFSVLDQGYERIWCSALKLLLFAPLPKATILKQLGLWHVQRANDWLQEMIETNLITSKPCAALDDITDQNEQYGDEVSRDLPDRKSPGDTVADKECGEVWLAIHKHAVESLRAFFAKAAHAGDDHGKPEAQDGKGKRRSNRPLDLIALNAKAKHFLHRNRKMSIRKLAKKLHCSVGIAQKLNAWKAHMGRRHRSRKTKFEARELTENMMTTTPDAKAEDPLEAVCRREEEIAALKAEQEQEAAGGECPDYERS
ncbi:MAG: hypothetical protein ABSE73_16775 [Planctomycetota bacterium]